MSSPNMLTANELMRLHMPNKRTELVRGRLNVREPTGLRHGAIAGELTVRLRNFVAGRSLGIVVAAETGFKIFSDPDTVRAPDVGFIRADRVPRPLPRGYAAVAPDLAVEVLSPDDRAGEVLDKVGDWLTAGCRLVWVLDPERRIARVYRADGSESLVSIDGSLDGEDVVLGFACSIAEIL